MTQTALSKGKEKHGEGFDGIVSLTVDSKRYSVRNVNLMKVGQIFHMSTIQSKKGGNYV